MCGIVAVFHMKNAEGVTVSEKDKAFIIKYFLSELTMETESRGKDATGYFSLFQDGNGVGLKHGVKATEFCTKNWDNKEFTFRNHLNLIETYHNEESHLASVLSHCRAKTIGSEGDNNNNHPLYVDNLVGIHNGCLSNHTRIYSNIKDQIERVGAVDSEMIVQLAWLETNKGEKKFDTDMILNITKKLDGSYAFICLDKTDPNSVMILRDVRPVEFVYIRSAGLLVAVSEKKFFEHVINRYNSFTFYGIDAPSIEYESYTLPDDTGLILKLDTKITPETEIKDMLGTTIKTQHKADSHWADVSTYYSGASNNYYNNKHNNAYNGGYGNSYNQKNYSPNTNGVKNGLDAITDQNKKNDTQKDDDKNTQNRDTQENNENSTDTIDTLVWNKIEEKFEIDTKQEIDVYTSMSINSDKHMVFRNTSGLASKLGIDKTVVDSLTSVQLANRVSRTVYEEQTAELESEVIRLNNNEKLTEKKTTRARSVIINLRSIINTLTRILGKSYKTGQAVLTTQEATNMEGLWDFLYSNRQTEIRHTSLGAFIVKLKNDSIAKNNKGEK